MKMYKMSNLTKYVEKVKKYINENRSNRLVSEVLEEVNGDASEFVDALLFKFFVEEEDIPEIPCDLGAAFEYIKNEI